MSMRPFQNPSQRAAQQSRQAFQYRQRGIAWIKRQERERARKIKRARKTNRPQETGFQEAPSESQHSQQKPVSIDENQPHPLFVLTTVGAVLGAIICLWGFENWQLALMGLPIGAVAIIVLWLTLKILIFSMKVLLKPILFLIILSLISWFVCHLLGWSINNIFTSH